jgi:lipopolysaccharide export system protein LptA
MLNLAHLNGQEIMLKADRMKGEKRKGENYQILRGNVMFEQSGSVVTCDEAEYNTVKEELEGFGNVRIVGSEGAVVSGNRLFFDNKNKTARVDGNVVLRDKSMVLTTPWIIYHTDTRIGYYGAGGKIVDDELTLTSRTGSYNPSLSMLYFRYNVILNHPDYIVKTDTLQYSNRTGNAWFFNFTEIQSDENTILCNYGSYNTRSGQSYFTRNAALISKENTIRADTLSYNRNTGIGHANGRLWVKDTSQNISIFGNRGYYDKNRKYTRVMGNTLAKKMEKNGDSLMLKADTFVYVADTNTQKRYLHAFHRTSLWRTDFSGTADSLTYQADDSVFNLYGKPVLWNENTRLNADTVRIFIANSRIKLMHMRQKSFIAMQEDTGHFSQISGTDMDNYFSADNKLKTIRVKGDGKSIYYIKEKDTIVTSANAVQYNHMQIDLDSNRVSGVRFYGNPSGTLFPIGDFPTEKKILPGFVWDADKRPTALQFQAPFPVPPLPARHPADNAPQKNNGRKKNKG